MAGLHSLPPPRERTELQQELHRRIDDAYNQETETSKVVGVVHMIFYSDGGAATFFERPKLRDLDEGLVQKIGSGLWWAWVEKELHAMQSYAEAASCVDDALDQDG